jgi:hypothetical protein
MEQEVQGSDGIVRRFQDWCASPAAFLQYGRVMSLQTLIGLCERDEKGDFVDIRLADSSDPNFYMYNLWFVVVSDGLFDMRFQTVQATQAIGIKEPSGLLRSYYNKEKNDFYNLRKVALRILYPQALIKEGVGYDGEMIVRGKKVFMAGSGHLLNMLTLDNSRIICWRTWMDSIENGLKIILYKKYNRIEYKLLYEDYMTLFTLGSITEVYSDEPLIFWHSFIDYRIALATYLLYVCLFKFKLDLTVFKYIQVRLALIRNLSEHFEIDVPSFIKTELEKSRENDRVTRMPDKHLKPDQQ